MEFHVHALALASARCKPEALSVGVDVRQRAAMDARRRSREE
jgi:hypothetical protein